jgi:hypothetical protein
LVQQRLESCLEAASWPKAVAQYMQSSRDARRLPGSILRLRRAAYSVVKRWGRAGLLDCLLSPSRRAE